MGVGGSVKLELGVSGEVVVEGQFNVTRGLLLLVINLTQVMDDLISVSLCDCVRVRVCVNISQMVEVLSKRLLVTST